ncbi:MAG: hypothetical protein A3J93_03205 [Candidatus Magasanikbacteria bacterium RIFOXYC2_FULL_42_28]|uniref:ParB-like N-terminal domain-containing protein n=1 Tax=Candidatus Magasanikbacteria bacterium RIFOXYC2_FULL_42_28 TaxID=1798704 RepID=A0A1F6NUG4_9BACT|nr:MAG: hypothetical protein A3J93_03205 [Candidatus Magasanikbacteria bacterium RIFOXYC2_FULL_42_28]
MALGRGLSALISPHGKSASITSKTEAGSDPKIWHIPVNNILPNPGQPRRHFAPEELQELSASIKEYGVLQPILVTERTDGGYELVAGERRLRATKLTGLPTIPAIIKKLADQAKLEIALVENIQRENLNPLEEAFAYQRLCEEFNLTQQAVADKVGKSRPYVANAIRLLDLPEVAKKALSEGKISYSQGRTLLTLPEVAQQLDLLASMLGQKITVRELERTVAQKTAGKFSRRDPNLMFLEDKLRSALGAKVAITKKGNSGTVVITYHSDEELKNIVKQIGGE